MNFSRYNVKHYKLWNVSRFIKIKRFFFFFMFAQTNKQTNTFHNTFLRPDPGLRVKDNISLCKVTSADFIQLCPTCCVSLSVNERRVVLVMTLLSVSTFEMPPRGSWRPFTPHNTPTRLEAHTHTRETSGVDGAPCRSHGGGRRGWERETQREAKGSQRTTEGEIL